MQASGPGQTGRLVRAAETVGPSTGRPIANGFELSIERSISVRGLGVLAGAGTSWRGQWTGSP